MKSLNNVEPETTVVVKEITGGLDTKQHLEELGVKEGVELTVVATEPVHVHGGPISLATGDQELIVARGWADKIYVALGVSDYPNSWLRREIRVVPRKRYNTYGRHHHHAPP